MDHTELTHPAHPSAILFQAHIRRDHLATAEANLSQETDHYWRFVEKTDMPLPHAQTTGHTLHASDKQAGGPTDWL